MSASFYVGSTKAEIVNEGSGESVRVSNVGGTLYYKSTADVSASSNDGSIATGAAAVITGPAYVISSTTSFVTVTSPTSSGAGAVEAISASDALFAGTVRITGGNNITASTDASGVALSGPTVLRHLAASDAVFSSGTVSITGAGEGITVNTAASKIQISGSQTGVKHLAASDAVFSSGTVSVTGAGEGITVNTAASKIQVSGSQTGVKHLVASDATFSSGTVSITGMGAATVNTAASKIQVSVPAAESIEALEAPFPGPAAYAASRFMTSANASFQPVHVPAHLSVDRLGFGLSMTTSTTNDSGGLRVDVGLYTRNGSSLSSLATSSYTTSWTSNSTGADWLSVSGARRWDMPFATSLTPGEYFLGFQVSQLTNWNGGHLGGAGGILRVTTSAGSGASFQGYPFGFGFGSNAISNNASHAGSDIGMHGTTTAGLPVPWLYLRNSTARPW